MTRDVENIDRVEYMVFCGDKGSAMRKFQNNGFSHHEIPTLTNDPTTFTQFVARNSQTYHGQVGPRGSIHEVSNKKEDYKDDRERAAAYDKAILNQPKNTNLQDFLSKYGNLLDDDDDPMPSRESMGMAGISELVNDDDDDADLS